MAELWDVLDENKQKTGKIVERGKDILQKLGLKVKLDGVGYVTEQSVAPGTDITNGMEITLKLAPKYQ